MSPVDEQLQTIGGAESGVVSIGRSVGRGVMGDQPVEREFLLLQAGQHMIEVGGLPFGGDGDAGFPHEGRREGEIEPPRVKASENDPPSSGEAGNDEIDDFGIAAGIDHAAIIAALIRLGGEHVVTRIAFLARRIGLPHHGGVTGGDGEARHQAPEHAMADNQLRGLAGNGERMLGGGGEGEQHAAITQIGIDRDGAGGRQHDPRRIAAEQAAHIAKATCAGHEDGLADAGFGRADSIGNATDRFIAWHQGVSHAGEGRHGAGPKQFFGASADAAPVNLDQHIAIGHRVQCQAAQGDLLGRVDNDGEAIEGG